MVIYMPINFLPHSYAMRWHRSWSTLVQVMACCLTALSQWWWTNVDLISTGPAGLYLMEIQQKLNKYSLFAKGFNITYLKILLQPQGANRLINGWTDRYDRIRTAKSCHEQINHTANMIVCWVLVLDRKGLLRLIARQVHLYTSKSSPYTHLKRYLRIIWSQSNVNLVPR